MADQVQTQDPPEGTAAQPAAAPDPFSLDENSLISLSPEQRAAVEPIIDSWKKKASEEITKRDSEIEKYKSYSEKANALDKLTQYQPFVQWWQQQQQHAQANATPAQAQAIGQTKPGDIASQAEWQEAVYEASQGDGSKLATIQARMMATWSAPVLARFEEKQKILDTRLEMRDLFEEHPDAKDLDMIGLDPKTKEGTSLLEIGLEWAENNGKTMEEGYSFAKRLHDSMNVTAQQKAMGLVTEKKQTVTAGPSTTSSSGNVVEVGSVDELLRKSMESEIAGDRSTRFVLKK